MSHSFLDLPYLTWNQTPITVAGNGTAGNTQNTLRNPQYVSIDNCSNVYVADTYNDRIMKFTNGSLIGTVLVSGRGSGLGQVNSPTVSFVDKNGNLYVVDALNYRVLKFANIGCTSPSVSLVGQVVAGGSYGSGYNQQGAVYGIAVDYLGNLYVSDYSNNRVMKWASGATKGTLVAGVGDGTGGKGAGQLQCPMGIAVDSNLSIYIADACNSRVQKWGNGASVGTTAASSITGALNYPTAVAVDTYGTLYVLENNRLLRFFPGSTALMTVITFSGDSLSSFTMDPAGNVYAAMVYTSVINKYTISRNTCGSYVLSELLTYFS